MEEERRFVGVAVRPRKQVRGGVLKRSRKSGFITLLALGAIGVFATAAPVNFAVTGFSRAADVPPAANLAMLPDVDADENFYQPLPVDEGLGARYILVNLAEQRMTAFEDSQEVFSAQISTGSRRSPTPAGKFAVKNKYPRAYSSVAGLYMPYWMAFTRHDGHWLGFHELPEYPDGTKEGAEHLGQPYSGGCIRLGVGDAEIIRLGRSRG